MQTVQIISKRGVVYCETTVPYSADTIRKMKKAGYTVKTVERSGDDERRD